MIYTCPFRLFNPFHARLSIEERKTDIMASATAINLSNNDASILHALFDPEGVVAEGIKIVPTVAKNGHQEQSQVEEEERRASRPLNKEQPTPEEIHESIFKLSDIISREARYASAYNNRAQAMRLLFRIEDFAEHPTDIRNIIMDLTMAISYATPPTSAAAVSERSASVLSSAHTHRGFLLWLASRPEMPQGMFSTIDGLKDLSKEELEDFASREFAMGGRYGNKIARELSVRTNPYAKLCGAIVKEALRMEIADHQVGPG